MTNPFQAHKLFSNTSRLGVWWFLYFAFQSALVRLGTDAGYSLVGFLDDAGFAACLLVLLACLRKFLPLSLSAVLMLVLSMTMIAAATANELYHETFHVWLGVHSLGAVEELDDIQSSIQALLHWDIILIWLCAPLLLCGGMFSAWKSWVPRRMGWWLLLGLGLLSAGSWARINVGAPSENHYLLSATRFEVRRVIRNRGAYDPDGILDGIALEQLIAPMAGYRRDGGVAQPWLQSPATFKRAVTLPNIIIIEAESFRSAESGVYGAEPSLTPEFDKLSRQGVRAHNFYATGIQTVRGELSVLCSTYPALGNSALYKRQPKSDLTCLPDILGASGYENLWFSGYKADYAGKREFLESHGFDVIYGVEAHGRSDDQLLGWGVSDETMADRIIERLARARQPFMATWITLSNHHPWNWDFPVTFPPHLELKPNADDYDHYKRGLFYTDHAIGYFVSRIREETWGERAWIVIVGDHGMHVFPEGSEISDLQKLEAHFRVPFLILAPDALEPAVIQRSASQVDIAPTLIEMMGIQVPNAFVGQSLLRDDDAPASPVLLVGENSASLVLDDERCMVAEVTCYENAQPQCAQGEKPALASHQCFQATTDLLFDQKAEMVRLPPERSARIRRILDVLPAMQSHLETHDKLGAGTSWPSILEDELSAQ